MNRYTPALLALGLLALTTTVASAQEIQWRYEYLSARREATSKNKPLIIDFGTQNCFFCKKLDMETFRDPSVARLMNENFICLKIDAEREAVLAQQLNIERYPTIVMASPEGKILANLEGFMVASRFQDNLQRVLASLADPEWMVRDYQAATQAVGKDNPRAIALLKRIVEDGKGRPVQAKSAKLLRDIEERAAQQLLASRQLEKKGQPEKAIPKLTEVIQNFPGTKSAQEAATRIQDVGSRPEVKVVQRTQRARDLLAQARDDYRGGQYMWCLERCDRLTRTFGDLPEAVEAHKLASLVKTNPDWIQSACDDMGQRMGQMQLSLADSWLRKGQPQKAVQCLEWVVQAFPGSNHAEAAQIKLASIKSQLTMQTDYRK